MGQLEEAGAWAGIIGAVLAAIAIWITILIYTRVQSIENNRRSEQKQHFKTLIINNVEEKTGIPKGLVALGIVLVGAFVTIKALSYISKKI